MAISFSSGHRKGAGSGRADSLLPVLGGIVRAAFSVSRIICHVLEFLYSGVSHAIGAAFGGGSGGMGLCTVLLSGKEASFLRIYFADGPAFSGDAGIQLSGAGRAGASRFPLGHDFAGNLVHLSCLYYDPFL